jgi:hypothetical protein
MFGKRRTPPQETSYELGHDADDDEPFSIIHGVKPTPDDQLDFYERYRDMSGGDTFEPMESQYQARLAARVVVAQSGVSLGLSDLG